MRCLYDCLPTRESLKRVRQALNHCNFSQILTASCGIDTHISLYQSNLTRYGNKNTEPPIHIKGEFFIYSLILVSVYFIYSICLIHIICSFQIMYSYSATALIQILIFRYILHVMLGTTGTPTQCYSHIQHTHTHKEKRKPAFVSEYWLLW